MVALLSTWEVHLASFCESLDSANSTLFFPVSLVWFPLLTLPCPAIDLATSLFTLRATHLHNVQDYSTAHELINPSVLWFTDPVHKIIKEFCTHTAAPRTRYKPFWISDPVCWRVIFKKSKK